MQLLHIKEVELCEIAAERGRSVRDLLSDKTSDAQLTELSFDHFIHIRREEFRHEHGRWHAARFEAIANAARDFFLSLGMPLAEPEDPEDARELKT